MAWTVNGSNIFLLSRGICTLPGKESIKDIQQNFLKYDVHVPLAQVGHCGDVFVGRGGGCDLQSVRAGRCDAFKVWRQLHPNWI